MNVRTLGAAAAAAVAALLLPALHSGAAAEPPPQSKRGKSAGCAVTLTSGDPSATAPLLASAILDQDLENPEHTANLGYYVKKTEYARSAANTALLAFTAPGTDPCGSISLVTFPWITGEAGPRTDAVQATTVPVAGSAQDFVLTSLLVELPANSRRDLKGNICIGSALEIRDSAGNLVESFPSDGPLTVCAGAAPGRTYI